MNLTRPSSNLGLGLTALGAHHEFMNKLLWTGLVLAGTASATPYAVQSYVKVGQTTRPAFAWCDAKDRILAVTAPAPALSGPDDVREVNLLRWLKSKPEPSNFRYKLGPMEGAAGSTYVGLIPAGFKATRDLASQYFIHISNVESPAGMGYRMQRVVRFKLPLGEYACRYVPNAAFVGATSKRTVIVWDEGDTITYTTRNFSGAPGVYVTGGHKTVSVKGGNVYEFKTEDGYRYRVWVDNLGPGTGSRVEILRNAKTISTETFLAYSVSRPAQ